MIAIELATEHPDLLAGVARLDTPLETLLAGAPPAIDAFLATRLS
jgi:hypothetical protein